MTLNIKQKVAILFALVVFSSTLITATNYLPQHADTPGVAIASGCSGETVCP